MIDRVTYWTELSDYDFETAKAMLSSKRYLYVGFMCHQSIEKILKAHWSKIFTDPPLKIHSLSRLSEKTNLTIDMTDDQLDLIDLLEPLNIEARYPSYKERLLRSLNPEKCNQIIEETDKLRIWIKNKL